MKNQPINSRYTQIFSSIGFTLIELLVVVLIIGILAAIAVPQYQKSIDRIQVATFFPAITSILKAQEIYYLDHGTYATKLTELDIDVSKVCPSLGGAAHENDLYNCKFGYKIINAASSVSESTQLLRFVLCPIGTNTTAGSSCGKQDPIMKTTFYFQNHEQAGTIGCTYNGERGKSLCQFILSHFNKTV